ncbi:Trk system potassium transporter TrkA [Halobaculum sp. MBLA0143]|uniref:Trk system potassium transporter TrkA n=1 Tax=Halobaculum sp. MBLA0143 TaxID=3079933 RepID=UPI003525447E
MHVIVVGAGQVGSNIAESLADTHDVVVIDTDGERVDALTYDIDVLAIEGDGADLETLREADVGRADLLIASTDDDETNVVVCGTAKVESEAFTIARVKRPQYLATWEHAVDAGNEAFGVDFMVCSDLLAARTIVEVIGVPTAEDVKSFSDGACRMAEFKIPANSSVAGETVSEADRFPGLTFAAIIRGEEVIVPRGETRLRPEDDLVVIGQPEEVEAFGAALAPDQTNPEEVVVFGGSEIGYQAAKLLAEQGTSPRLVEQDPDRARWLAEQLPEVTVMQHDATDQEFLERENVGGADAVIAALETDQGNLLATLLAKRLGADRAAAVVDNGEFTDLFEAVGVDVAISPRRVTAEEITRFTRTNYAETVSIIEDDRAEILELEVDADSDVVGQSVRDLAQELPASVVIGSITRGRELIIPRGDSHVEAGDHLVVFVEASDVDAVAATL